MSAALPLAVRGRRLLRITACAAAILVALLLTRAANIHAHANLVRSDPAANSLVATSPSEVVLEFREAPELDFADVVLYDAEGNVVLEAPLQASPQGELVTLFEPPSLPNGTYTVAWRVVSTVDGHATQGFFAFSVGERSAAPAEVSGIGTDPPPKALSVFSRWLTLSGIVLAVGVTGFVLGVVRPGNLLSQTGAATTGSLRWLWWTTVLVLLVGAVLALMVQAWRSAGGFSAGIDSLVDLVSDTRFGHTWLARILLVGFMLELTLLLDRHLFSSNRLKLVPWALLALSALGVAATLSLGSHAAASEDWTCWVLSPTG